MTATAIMMAIMGIIITASSVIPIGVGMVIITIQAQDITSTIAIAGLTAGTIISGIIGFSGAIAGAGIIGAMAIGVISTGISGAVMTGAIIAAEIVTATGVAGADGMAMVIGAAGAVVIATAMVIVTVVVVIAGTIVRDIRAAWLPVPMSA